MLLNYLTLKHCSSARNDYEENNIKSTEQTHFFTLCTNATICFSPSRLLVSLCLYVCLFRAVAAEQRHRLPFCHCQKTFQCAHCIADANQRIKGMLQADKEGLMPTSKPLTTITGDFPASLAQCKTKWRRAARYHNMAALSRDGHCLVTKKRKRCLCCKNGEKHGCFYDRSERRPGD